MSFLRVSQRSNNELSSLAKPLRMNPWGTYKLGASEKAILAYSDPLGRSSVAEQARYCVYILDFSQVGDLVRELSTGSIHFTSCNITQRISPTSAKRTDRNSSNCIKRGEHLKNATKLLNYLTETLLRKDYDADTDGDPNSEYELASDTSSSGSGISSEEDASEEGSASEGNNVTESDEYSEEDGSYSENERTSHRD
jgi:hypothetical protein